MKTQLWLVVGVAAALAGVTGLPARADVYQDLGFLPGGSLQLLEPALILDGDPVPPGAEKEPLYDSEAFTCPTGATATVGPYGFVVLNTAGPGNTKLITEVSVKNGIPNTTYEIYVNQDPGGCPTAPSGTLTTNAQGNGNGHVEGTRVLTATYFWASAFAPTNYPAPKSILRSPAAALD
jgi:hypothetical protein